MATRLINVPIPLVSLETELVYILLNVKPVFEYKDNKRTNTILGYIYITVNSESFERYEVKILGEPLLISAEELLARRQKGEKVFAEFDNAVIKLYWSPATRSYEDSVSADGIHFVETQ